MLILPVHQGTSEWHQAKAKHLRSASKAAAMMGASNQIMRNELLRMEATLSEQEFSEWAQKNLIDKGHEAEAAMRPIVEKYLKGALLPLTCTTDNGYLLASFDGICEELRAGWEHKLWNEVLAAQVRAKQLEPHYYWQLEHQAAVGNLDYIIFTCSDGTKENAAHMKYVPVPGRREALLAGWQQFDRDLADYQHVEVIPAATAAPVMALPALSIQVNGAITLTDNLAVFGEKLTAYVEQINKKPQSDQDFANLEAMVKTLKSAEEALDAAENSALAQTESIDTMRRTVGLYRTIARDNRLLATKLVASEKDNRRVEIRQKANDAFALHVANLNTRIGKPYLNLPIPDFAMAMKGLKTISSICNAVDTELANSKIKANETADRISLNLAWFNDYAKGYEFLFSDLPQIICL